MDTVRWQQRANQIPALAFHALDLLMNHESIDATQIGIGCSTHRTRARLMWQIEFVMPNLLILISVSTSSRTTIGSIGGIVHSNGCSITVELRGAFQRLRRVWRLHVAGP